MKQFLGLGPHRHNVVRLERRVARRLGRNQEPQNVVRTRTETASWMDGCRRKHEQPGSVHTYQRVHLRLILQNELQHSSKQYWSAWSRGALQARTVSRVRCWKSLASDCSRSRLDCEPDKTGVSREVSKKATTTCSRLVERNGLDGAHLLSE